MSTLSIRNMLRTLGAVALALATACAQSSPTATTEPTQAVPQAPQPALPATSSATAAAAHKYPDPPPPSAAPTVALPTIDRFALPNGLTVYLVENHEIPTVSIQLGIFAGAMDDPEIAGFTAAMLGEGTKARSKRQVDEAIEFVGGRIGQGSDTHTTWVWGQVLKRDVKLGLTLMADEAMNPRFADEALAKLKEQRKAALALEKSSSQTLATTLFGMVAYPPNHPYGRPFSQPAQVDQVKIDNLRKFHRDFYRSNNAFIVLAGDITRPEAEALVKRTFGAWTSAKTLPENPLNGFSEFHAAQTLTIHLVDRPGSPQSDIVVGNLAIARHHEAWPTLEVANAILGDDAVGRLFTDLREVKGLTYGIYSAITLGRVPGAFVVKTSTRTASTADLLVGIFDHLKRMRTQMPSESELAQTKRRLLGRLPLEIETAEQIAARVRTAVVFGLPLDEWSTYRTNVEAATAQDVFDVARKYMHAIPHVVVVGDASACEPQLRKSFPGAQIRKYDVNLNLATHETSESAHAP